MEFSLNTGCVCAEKKRGGGWYLCRGSGAGGPGGGRRDGTGRGAAPRTSARREIPPEKGGPGARQRNREGRESVGPCRPSEPVFVCLSVRPSEVCGARAGRAGAAARSCQHGRWAGRRDGVGGWDREWVLGGRGAAPFLSVPRGKPETPPPFLLLVLLKPRCRKSGCWFRGDAKFCVFALGGRVCGASATISPSATISWLG